MCPQLAHIKCMHVPQLAHIEACACPDRIAVCYEISKYRYLIGMQSVKTNAPDIRRKSKEENPYAMPNLLGFGWIEVFWKL